MTTPTDQPEEHNAGFRGLGFRGLGFLGLGFRVVPKESITNTVTGWSLGLRAYWIVVSGLGLWRKLKHAVCFDIQQGFFLGISGFFMELESTTVEGRCSS